MKLLSKNDFFFFLLIAIFFFGFFLIFSRSQKTEFVLIEIEGKEAYRFSTLQDSIYPIEWQNQVRLILHIESGKIAVTDSLCPQQVCVKQGFIALGWQIIVCVPQKILIHYENSRAVVGGSEIDAITK